MNLEALSTALLDYIQAYRAEYVSFTTPEAGQEDHPALPQSPFATPFRLDCLVLDDGMLLWERSHEPEGPWYVSGGPAIKVDYPQTRMPLQARVMLGMRGAHRQPEGVYRAVTPRDIPDDVWFGRFGTPADSRQDSLPQTCPVRLRRYAMTWREALRRATFGLLGDIAPAPEPDPMAGMPLEIVREVGIFPADLNSRPFYNYLAVDTATESAQWRGRLEASRVQRDVRRDFARTIAALQFDEKDIVAQITDHRRWLIRFRERQSCLREAADALARLLDGPSPPSSTAVQALLQHHAVLLDPYGQSVDTKISAPILHISRRPYQDYRIFRIAGGMAPLPRRSLLGAMKAAGSFREYRSTSDDGDSSGITPFPPARFRLVSIETRPTAGGVGPLSHDQQTKEESLSEHVRVTPEDLLRSARLTLQRWTALESSLPPEPSITGE